MNTSISFLIAGILLIGITLAAEWQFGSLADVSARDAQMQQTADKLAALPKSFGPWELVREDPFSDDVVAILECSGHVNRLYKNRDTGELVTVSLIVGPSGPMTAHRPEVCFSSRDYTPEGITTDETIESGGATHEFRQARFVSTRLDAQHIACYYGWTHDGTWTAPDAARFVLGSEPYLVKLQFTTHVSPESAESAQAVTNVEPTGERFLRDLLPVLNEELFPNKD